ncbi:phosphoglycerate mutase [Cylindrobasidium torrendii FP15055 ss-10]|uniref:Phosphoglycerate mutase n=1 Tax=Cylindrobasidium torrendii FP15055 ss-10 TaxID=1314674 RepID=A0A0D7BJ25_9AGAR|nr:phosphoglycerate mutase [Cylindrobasidium torrendii FP15055 ss-10]
MSYEAVPGFFQQDSVQGGLDGVLPRFGLLEKWTWEGLKEELARLNASSGANYKLFILGRHGQGYHNLAEIKYGTKKWDDYWSKFDGDGELTWGPDPELTPLGENQAKAAHDTWAKEISHIQPGIMLCSPMSRALHTCQLTFEGVLPSESFNVTIVEKCREEYGEHTCDKRKTKSEIATLFPAPTFSFESGFAEEDLLWTPERETVAHAVARAGDVLDRVFAGEWGTSDYVSITAHGGIINAFLRSVGRPDYVLPTGGVLPLVIKSVKP